MIALQGLLEQVSTALGVAVLHSLWQCALVGALATLVLMFVRRASVRYLVWCTAMVLCIAWMLVTFIGSMWPGSGAAGAMGDVGLSDAAYLAAMMSGSGSGSLLFEVTAWVWAGGVVFCSLRFGFQWVAARRLRTLGIVECEGRWKTMFDEVRYGLGVSRRVRMLVSTRAVTPMVVGWVWPVVVVPMSALTMLSPEQVRLVLVHELAHVRRFDHLVNALQVLIETVLFYHPVVWWMSHQARVEREHCCDDAAVRWGGDAVLFARALTELEMTRTHSRAVLALNQGGSLMERITRILGASDRSRLGGRPLRTMVALGVGSLVAAGGIANAALRVEEPRDAHIEVVRSGVDSGVMTHEQARMIFDTVIFPGSDMQIDMEEELDRIHTDIENAVLAGKVTREQAQRKLDALDRTMEERVSRRFKMSVLGMTRDEARLSVLADTLAALVEAGELTQEKADAKLAMAQRRANVVIDLLATVEGDGVVIRADVELGKLTNVEGEERIAAVDLTAVDLLQKVELDRQFEEAVVVGNLTRVVEGEVVEGKVVDGTEVVYLEMLPIIRNTETEVEVIGVENVVIEEYTVVPGDTLGSISAKLYGEEEYQKAIAEYNKIVDPSRLEVGMLLRVPSLSIIGECELPMRSMYSSLTDADRIAEFRYAVEAGKLTAAEGAAAIDKLRAQERVVLGDRADAYIERLDVELQELVASGEISGAQAKARAQEARERMKLRLDWSKMEESIRAAVKVGMITEAEANAKFAALRDRRTEAIAAEWSAVQARIESGVKEGTMTREEAERAYERAAERLFPAKEGVIGARPVQGRLNVPVLNDVPVLLEGVHVDALHARDAHEQGVYAYFQRNLKSEFVQRIEADVNAGRMTDDEGAAQIEKEIRRQQFGARWFSISHMYQEEVGAGRMTVDEANAHLKRALKSNGYFESEFRSDSAEAGMMVVEPDHVFEIMNQPKEAVGEPEEEIIEFEIQVDPVRDEGKLTPNDEAYWYHQGIRPYDPDDELDDC